MTSTLRHRRTSASARLTELRPTPAITPLSLLSSALDRGADEHVLSQLIGLHERSRAEDARRAFEAALTAAKAKLPVIAKTQAASIGAKHYRHEDLAEMLEGQRNQALRQIMVSCMAGRGYSLPPVCHSVKNRSANKRLSRHRASIPARLSSRIP